MGYSPWGCEELDMTERLTLSLSFKIRAKESPLLTTRAPRLGCILSSPSVPGPTVHQEWRPQSLNLREWHKGTRSEKSMRGVTESPGPWEEPSVAKAPW